MRRRLGPAIGLAITLLCLGSALATRAQNSPESSPAAPGRDTIDLSGEWEFRMDPEDRGRAEKWFEPGTAFDRKILVPGAWNAQGIHYESEKLLGEFEQNRQNVQ